MKWDEMLKSVGTKLENIRKKSFDNGKIIKDGIKTAIIGKPNAGKSSLLNCNFKRRQSYSYWDIEGTTRDTIEEFVTIRWSSIKIDWYCRNTNGI